MASAQGSLSHGKFPVERYDSHRLVHHCFRTILTESSNAAVVNADVHRLCLVEQSHGYSAGKRQPSIYSLNYARSGSDRVVAAERGSIGKCGCTDLAEQDKREVLESVESPGTHRGHNKVFLAAPRTPSSASVFLWFLRVTFSYPAFTAVTRVQISSGTPTFSTTCGIADFGALRKVVAIGKPSEERLEHPR